MQVNIESAGWTSDREPSRYQYVIADLRPSVHIHQTSLDHDEDSRYFGSSQMILSALTGGAGASEQNDRAAGLALDAFVRAFLNEPQGATLDGSALDDNERLAAALNASSAAVNTEARVLKCSRNMDAWGCFTAIHWPQLTLFSTGLAGAYLWRNGTTSELSEVREELSLLTSSAVGEQECIPVQLQAGDRLLLACGPDLKSLNRAIVSEALSATTPPSQTLPRLGSRLSFTGGLVVLAFDYGERSSHSEVLDRVAAADSPLNSVQTPQTAFDSDAARASASFRENAGIR